jgi:hypothetical protein
MQEQVSRTYLQFFVQVILRFFRVYVCILKSSSRSFVYVMYRRWYLDKYPLVKQHHGNTHTDMHLHTRMHTLTCTIVSRRQRRQHGSVQFPHHDTSFWNQELHIMCVLSQHEYCKCPSALDTPSFISFHDQRPCAHAYSSECGVFLVSVIYVSVCSMLIYMVHGFSLHMSIPRLASIYVGNPDLFRRISPAHNHRMYGSIFTFRMRGASRRVNSRLSCTYSEQCISSSQMPTFVRDLLMCKNLHRHSFQCFYPHLVKLLKFLTHQKKTVAWYS